MRKVIGYVIRTGRARGDGLYWDGDHWVYELRDAVVYRAKWVAENESKRLNASPPLRVVRITSGRRCASLEAHDETLSLAMSAGLEECERLRSQLRTLQSRYARVIRAALGHFTYLSKCAEGSSKTFQYEVEL